MRDATAETGGTDQPKPASGPRLKFIDLARSVAILMMLQGHFIDVTLADAYRHNAVHASWQQFRGLAAPMFFATTGLIFVYLLSGNAAGPLLSLPRVRKGFVRSLELLFWGYLLQLNVTRIPEYFRTGPDHWIGAFHVLQCIAIGIVMLIGVFAVHRLLPRVPLPLCYVAAAIGLCLFDSYLYNLPAGSRFPATAPELIQNAFKGRLSVFPIAPWLVFTLYGGAIGALVRIAPAHMRKAGPLMICAGIAMKYSGVYIDRGISFISNLITGRPMIPEHWIHDRAGEILTLLGILVLIDQRLDLRESWLLKIGRNTLPVYIAHVIVLYNGLFGIGLRSYWERALDPWQAIAGALVFMASGVFLALAIEKFSGRPAKSAVPQTAS